MRSTPARSTADILIELLGKVPDAATLEVLLAPENLTKLLRAQGWTDDAVRTALMPHQARPGELLLDVLRQQPDTTMLLAQLGNPPLAPRAARGSSMASGTGRAGSSARGWAGVILGLLLAVPTAWYLFVRLDVIHAAGLIRYFPGVYARLTAFLVMGCVAIVAGLVELGRVARNRR